MTTGKSGDALAGVSYSIVNRGPKAAVASFVNLQSTGCWPPLVYASKGIEER